MSSYVPTALNVGILELKTLQQLLASGKFYCLLLVSDSVHSRHDSLETIAKLVYPKYSKH